MTDPRIEAAAKALGEYVYERNGKPLKWEDMGDNQQEVARCYARVALAAADAAAWRPIATVPRDGTRVIAYRPEAPATQDNVFEIVAGDNRATKSPQGVTHYTDGWCHPTHWQPLPAPPANIAELGGVDG